MTSRPATIRFGLPHLAGTNTKQTGDTTEAKIIADLVSYGYSISIPFGDNDPYDFVVDDRDTLYRVQCKAAWKNKEDTIRFNTHSQTTKNEALYWIDIDDATK